MINGIYFFLLQKPNGINKMYYVLNHTNQLNSIEKH